MDIVSFRWMEKCAFVKLFVCIKCNSNVVDVEQEHLIFVVDMVFSNPIWLVRIVKIQKLRFRNASVLEFYILQT